MLSTIGERIKRVRKERELTQQKFAEAIGVKQNTVAQYEIGRNEPIETVIALICSRFNVDEKWLRTGEGDGPFVPLSREAEIAQIVGQFMNSSPEREALILALARATDDEIKAAAALTLRFAAELSRSNKKTDDS